ncbi:DNA polymerase III subunit beta [Eremococcus coleocola]|uniref:DNA polymerase III subunit beta n=1 Tax=Eremococcus coleocola TaxID=88132 RepID=UPI00040A9488|nr:DNA polymerase III subunit beta [Eremococcus coleocola]
MKFTINRQKFTDVLNNVSRAIPGKTTIPILTGIKIEVNPDGVTLIGSDADISIESFLSNQDESLQLNIKEQGSIVVGARLFNDIIRKLPTNEILLESDSNYLLTITSGPAVFTLNGQDGAAYPHLPEIDFENTVSLPTLAFKEMINHTIFSASNQESRPILTGLNLSIHPDYISGVATDSHRLSRREIPVELNTDLLDLTNVTIPKKTVTELVRIVEDDQKLQMLVNEQQVIFILENLTIYSRLLEGNYPDTDRLIPSDHQTQLVVNANDFLAAIERASLMSHQSKNNIVQLSIKDQAVELSVSGNERGRASEDIQLKAVSGQDLLISFNPDYMRDALKSFNGIDIKIDFQTAVRPMLLSALDGSDLAHNELLQLLTPIRTHQS